MNESKTHPSQEELQKLLFGMLSDARSERLYAHIDNCIECEAELSRIDARSVHDSVIMKMRASPPEFESKLSGATQDAESKECMATVSEPPYVDSDPSVTDNVTGENRVNIPAKPLPVNGLSQQAPQRNGLWIVVVIMCLAPFSILGLGAVVVCWLYVARSSHEHALAPVEVPMDARDEATSYPPIRADGAPLRIRAPNQTTSKPIMIVPAEAEFSFPYESKELVELSSHAAFQRLKSDPRGAAASFKGKRLRLYVQFSHFNKNDMVFGPCFTPTEKKELSAEAAELRETEVSSWTGNVALRRSDVDSVNKFKSGHQFWVDCEFGEIEQGALTIARFTSGRLAAKPESTGNRQ